MKWKPLKLKVRDPLLVYEHYFNDDCYIYCGLDFYELGLGFDYMLSDSRRHFEMHLLWLHLELWF